MISGAHDLIGHVEAGFCAQLSPERLVKDFSGTITEACSATGDKVKPAFPLGDSPSRALAPTAAPEHAILGLLVDLSSRAESPPPWRRWANPCHWSCQRCTERLGYVLIGHALTVLHGLAGEAPRPTLGTLTISPPGGIKLSELRQAVEEVDSANGGHAIWGLKIQDKGRAIAYMLTTTSDPKLLERQARTSVRGDSRSAWFSRVRGSELPWAPPAEAFAFHVGRVLRCLTRRCPEPPTLHPGHRFGASGRFAPVLAHALASLRREHPCQGVGRQRTQKHARELSPDALGEVTRACRWCRLAVSGRAWRHRHCSTRRWRAQCALRSELSPEDFDGFMYQTDVMVQQGTPEPEAMRRAFLEFAGKNTALPKRFLEVITLPTESMPPGRRAPIVLRIKNRGERHD
jgi:hypothetical protein